MKCNESKTPLVHCKYVFIVIKIFKLTKMFKFIYLVTEFDTQMGDEIDLEVKNRLIKLLTN